MLGQELIEQSSYIIFLQMIFSSEDKIYFLMINLCEIGGKK